MQFLAVFIPLFIAIDPLGVLPIFISLTSHFPEIRKKIVVTNSLAAGFLVAIGFLFLGKGFLNILGIEKEDFLIAGGAVLFILGLYDLIFPEKRKSPPSEVEGVVPLGVPLLVGPAVLTTILLLVDKFGVLLTFISLILNLTLSGIVLIKSEILLKILGERGIKVISKLMSLILSALGIRLIREGFLIFLNLKT